MLTEDLSYLFTLSGIGGLLMLILMEVVLGIDNLIFISIIAGKLPKQDQKKARAYGLSIALIVRVILLFGITWLIGLTKPIVEFQGYSLSFKDIILFVGGIFLMVSSINEIHHKIEGGDSDTKPGMQLKLRKAIIQIVILDIVFSFDSILTAVGLSRHVLIMVIAVIISMIIMLVFSGSVSRFVNKHPTIKMLALSFLLMIGVLLAIEGLPDQLAIEVPKNYLYVSMIFSLAVEMLNIRMRSKSKKAVQLKDDKELDV
ncbi:MAG: TerC family protein [Bacteroidota bacterium]|nr:TerC family protein [Bacteroidota bacterium]